MDYGDLLKRGWNITWNHKYLWWLGFLAALGGSAGSGGGSGGGSNFSFPSGSGSSSPTTGTGSGDLPFDEAQIEQFFEGFSNNGDVLAGVGIAFVALFACLFLFFIVMWFVRLAAEAGLIHAASEINDGQKTSFGSAFGHGRGHMGTLFVVNLILQGPIILIGLLFACAAVMLIGGSTGAGSADAMAAAGGTVAFVAICFACLLIPYGLIVQLMYPIAQRGVVLKNMGAMESVRHAWAVLKANVGEMLLLGIISWFMMLVFGIASALVALPILFATFAPVIISFINSETLSVGLSILAGGGVLLAMIVGSFVSAIMVVMRSSTFTLAYLEMMGRMKLATVVE
ncbi:MAG: hypothetical protein OT477_21115 [Chloroflexi bacterium]|nr:hypothetical protein [Chloroflexota bacterium]